MERKLIPLLALAVFALAVSPRAKSQAVGTINTIAGGVPNNLPATSVSVGYPFSVAADSNGNTWLASGGNGAFGGLVFKIDAGGNLTTVAGNGSLVYTSLLANGDGGPATSAYIGQITGFAVDSQDNLYIADSTFLTVRKVAASTGIITTIAGGGSGCTGETDSYGDGCPATSAIIYAGRMWIDANQNMYFVDLGANTIREVVAATGIVRNVVGGGAGCTGQTDAVGDGCPASSAILSEPEGLFVAPNGDIYIADAGNQRVRKVTAASGIISTIAGTGTPGFTGDGGPATAAEISTPQGARLDSSGNFFFADSGNGRIREILASTGVIQTVAGGGIGVCTGATDIFGDGCLATSAILINPTNVSISSNTFLVSDSDDSLLRQFTLGGTISALAGNGLPWLSGDGRTALTAQFYEPYAAATDSSGNLYVADSANDRIRRIDAVTKIVTTIAGGGTGCPGQTDSFGDGCLSAQATVFPSGIFLDSAGNIYFSDFLGLVRKISVSTGIITAIAGGGTGCTTQTDTVGDGCLASQATLADPWGLYVDNSGNIFFSDYANSRVRKVSSSTGIITTIAGTGTPGYNGDNIPAATAQISYAWGIYGDAQGNIYIADYGNSRVRQIVASTGNIVTIAGTGTPGYNGDNIPATTAQVQFPGSIFVDHSGNIFFLDYGRIREIVASTGLIQTVAGDGILGFRGDGGPAILAEGDSYGLSGDAAGNLYLADTLNNRIREVYGVAPGNSFAIATSTLPAATVGAAYSFGLQAVGGTPPYTWSLTSGSLPPGFAALSSNGVLSGEPTAAGTYTFTVQAADSANNFQSASFTITVNPASVVTLNTITVNPTNPSIAKGLTQQFSATGNYSDGSQQDITSQVTWNSGTTSVATISATGLATGVGIGTSNITASLNGVTSPADTLTVSAAILQVIAVTPASPSIVQGLTQQFAATGIYSDGSNIDVSSQVTWNSATTTVATINSTGLATGVGPGTSNITASLLGITSAPDVLTVNATACIANPPGLVSWYTADGTVADLLGANPSSATNAISYVAGQVGQGFKFGTGGYLDIPQSASLSNQRFTWLAWVRPDGAGPNNDFFGNVIIDQDIDNTDDSVALTWRSTDNRFGFFFGYSLTEQIISNRTFPPGQFHLVTASYDGSTFTLYVDGQVEGTYSESKAIDYTSIGWTIGASSPNIRAENYPRTWNGVIDEVQAYNVVLTQTQIQAIYNNGSGGECKGPQPSIVVSPSPINFGNVATNSASPVIVTIMNPGAATLAVNSVASSGAPFTVTNLPSTPINVPPGGGSTTFNAVFAPTQSGAANGTITITSTASSSPWVIALTGTGTATALQSIVLSPANPSIAKGVMQQFTATGNYSDGSQQDITSQVTWNSGTTTVATISATGLATGVGVGTSNITASLNGVTSPADVLTVTPAILQTIVVTPSGPTIAKGLTQQFTATGIYSDGSMVDLSTQVSWNSATTTVATVSAAGLATAVNTGTTNITASLLGITSPIDTLTVTAPAVQSITVLPANTTLPVGGIQQYIALGTFSDGTKQNLAGSVSWQSSNTAIATTNSSGAATAVNAGAPVTITATSTANPAVSGTAQLNVSGAAPFAYAGDFVSANCCMDVIDTSSNQIVKTIPITNINEPIGMTPDQSRIYVPDNADNLVDVIDTTTNTLVGTIPIGNSPTSVAITPDGKFGYVADFGDNNVNVFNVATNAITASIPIGFLAGWDTVTPDGAWVYVGSTVDGRVAVINTATNTLSTTFTLNAPSGQPAPIFISGPTFNPTGTLAYFALGNPSTSTTPGTISVVAIPSNTVVANITVGVVPFQTAISPDGTRLYVANAISNTVSVVNTATNTVIATVPIPGHAESISVTPDGTKVYVAATNGAAISVINTSTNTVTTNIATTVPFGIAIASPPPASAATTLTLTPPNLIFSSQLQGTTSTPQTISVKNPGATPVTLADISLTGPNTGAFLLTNGCPAPPATLGAGATCSLQVSFAPSAAAQFTALISVTNNNGTATYAQSAPLSGTGVSLSSIALSPLNPSILQGSTQQFTATGTLSDATQADITNQVTWHSAATSVASINASGLATGIGPGTSNITASFGAVTSPVDLLTVTPVVILAPGAGVSPASLTYGNQVIGTSSGGQTVIVNSTGTDPLTISSIALSGANPAEYSQTNNCPLSPATLPAGQSCTIQVSFAPLAVGTRTANLVVTDNDSNVVGSQQSVSLTGTASAPAPTVTSVDVPFTPGTNVSNVATINCPSNTSPCTDPNAHSLKIQFSQVNTPFVMTVTAYEVPLSEANGVCAVGSNETTDFDCRFTQFFPIQNQANGDVIVPQCIPYSNGNCVFYRITNAPGASAYTGPVFENISWNNTAYLPPAFYQVNNPRAYDDPDYSPYDVNHQFALDITDFFNPIAQVGTDPTITMHTTRFSDFTIAWPGSLPNPGYTFTFQAPLNGTPSVTQGTTIPVAFSLTQSGTPIANALTPPNVVSLGLLNGQGTRLPALAPDGSAAAFVYNSQAQVYQLTLATQNLVPGTYTLLVSSNLFSQQVATFTITPVPLQIVTSSPLTSGTNGVLYPQAFTAIGGTAPYSWVISNGSLPNGVTLTTGGFLDGTPTATGTFTFTLQVTDAAQSSQSQVYSLTINPPALVSIAVTPANASITQGTTQQFTASGTYTDNSTQNLTASVTWTSSSTAIVSISASGLATGVSMGGPATITATLGNIHGMASLTVTSKFGDVNGDGMINCTDLDLVKSSVGKKAGQPGFDPRADVNGDRVVNILDLTAVSRLLPAGTVCQ